MHLSRIRINNFRNFYDFDVRLAGNVLVVGENRVGKSNLMYALRLLFDPSLPESARQLSMSDFWDGMDSLLDDFRIVISVEIEDFEDDLDVLAILTDFRLDSDPDTVRLTYEFRPRAELKGEPSTNADFEHICYGGDSESKEFDYGLRRRITMDLLPALRDAESDLANWRRSPMRPLIEEAFRDVKPDDLKNIEEAIKDATDKIIEFGEVKALEKDIGRLFAKLSGPRQDVRPRLGLNSTDPTRLYRNIRLLIDGGARGISEASLGSANLIFLSLKTLEVNQLIAQSTRDHSFLAIEEPEAHLHPHLQRSVYRQLFENVKDDSPLSVFLTTHSPHIASVAPLRSIVLLKDTPDSGTVGRSTASLTLTDGEVDDLSRYLDVTRAEMLFARGVILVEGDAERFLMPTFAETLGISLDHLGITVCSVAGTNFVPYAKFLTGLGIPFAVVTDWDPQGEDSALGWNRSRKLVSVIEETRTGKIPTLVLTKLDEAEDGNEFAKQCEAYGIFSNLDTLEVDLFGASTFRPHILKTLNERKWGVERKAALAQWEADSKTLDRGQYLSMIESIGKGRFAQRLVSRISEVDPPAYITRAIKFVARYV